VQRVECIVQSCGVPSGRFDKLEFVELSENHMVGAGHDPPTQVQTTTRGGFPANGVVSVE